MIIKNLSTNELENHYVGEGFSVATIMAIFAVAIMAVVTYKIFISSKGSATIPGGWKFTWN